MGDARKIDPRESKIDAPVEGEIGLGNTGSLGVVMVAIPLGLVVLISLTAYFLGYKS